MNFFVTAQGTAQFQHLDVPLAKLLSLSFSKTNKNSHFFKELLYSILCEKSPEFSIDWEKYIEPEVSSLLAECHAIVLSDLGKIKKESHDSTEEVTLTIPAAHHEAWLRMLSVARFAVANALQTKTSTELLLQQDFLTLLQQCLVEASES